VYGEPRRLRPDVNVPLFARLEGCIECTQRDGHPVFIAFLPDANAIAGVVLRIGAPKTTTEDKTSALFAGKKQRWRQPCESLIAKVKKFAPGVAAAVGGTYVSLVREGKKFAILQPSSADRLDIGIKLKGERLNAPFEAAGKWNAMVTHRAKIRETEDIDEELFSWLRRAYDSAAK